MRKLDKLVEMEKNRVETNFVYSRCNGYSLLNNQQHHSMCICNYFKEFFFFALKLRKFDRFFFVLGFKIDLLGFSAKNLGFLIKLT